MREKDCLTSFNLNAMARAGMGKFKGLPRSKIEKNF
jgi:hypothetical protein